VTTPIIPDTLACRADLANVYHAAGRLTDAATLLRDTLARCEQAHPSGDPLTRTMRAKGHDRYRGRLSKPRAAGQQETMSPPVPARER
jgi:hypothetical protein